MATVPPGTQLGPYRVEATLGSGAMGTVVRARRAVDGGLVAVKLLTSGAGATAAQRERFEREAQLAARLSHPGVVRVHDAGIARGVPYFAMDLVDGEPLSDRVGRLAPLEAAALVAQVARAVAHAHAQGVVHRDLKPTNVLVRREDGRALVTDFGVARATDGASSLTMTGALVGSPHYMSPEQAIGGQAGPESDVHALGAVLFEAITGRPPFVADDLGALLVAITSSAPPRPGALAAHVPPALEAACLAALAKDPARRPSADALAQALEDVVAGRARVAPRRTLWLVGAAGLSLAALAGGALALRDDEAPAGSPPAAVDDAATEAPSAPRAAPWAAPPWLLALERRGDTPALLAAEAALAGTAEVHPRTRARALELLAELDATWRDPGLDPSSPDEAERLLWIHAVALRLDPAHVVAPERRAAIKSLASFGLSQAFADDRIARNGPAMIRLFPDELEGYFRFAEAAGPRHDHGDGAVLRRGIELARVHPPARGKLMSIYVRWLRHVTGTEPARAAWARAEVARVAAQSLELAGDEPARVVEVLLLAAEGERDDPARAIEFTARAEELVGPRLDVLAAAAVAAQRHYEASGEPLEFLGLERAFERAMAAFERSREPVTHTLLNPVVLGTLRSLERREAFDLAVAVCDRALALRGDSPRLPIALCKVLYLVRLGRSASSVRPALRDLSIRAELHLERVAARGRLPAASVATLREHVNRIIGIAFDYTREAITEAEVAERLEALRATRDDLLGDRD